MIFFAICQFTDKKTDEKIQESHQSQSLDFVYEPVLLNGERSTEGPRSFLSKSH